VKPIVKVKPKAKFVPPPPVAKKSTPVSKPMSRASGSGSIMKTKAEIAKEKEATKKSANGEVFSFLEDPKDVSIHPF
jgi:hypothetical protein